MRLSNGSPECGRLLLRQLRRHATVKDGLYGEQGCLGSFLRSNAPDAGRWYSRDVGAIARARGLTAPVAAWFIDADATPNAGGYPVGGLTIVKFRNSHLVYALTWFGLCALSFAGAGLLLRHGRRG